MKLYRWAGIAALMLALLLGTAQAAARREISFEWTTDGETLTVAAYHRGDKTDYHLYLPGNCDASALKVTMTGWDEIFLDEIPLKNGETVDLRSKIGTEATLSRGNTRLGTMQIMKGSAIPNLFFTLSGGDWPILLSRFDYVLKEPASVTVLDGSGKVAHKGALKNFCLRGNSTRYYPKKPYQFKLEEKADLFGMGEGKTWVLLANAMDVTLVRNQITYDLCREMGMKGTPECIQADMYINGQYQGIYLLTEKIQLKDTRLDIRDLEDKTEKINDKPLDSYPMKSAAENGIKMKWFDIPNEPEDITGGYLLEIEKPLQYTNSRENAGFCTDGGMCVIVKEPSNAGEGMIRYISAIVNDFHLGVLNADGVSPQTGRRYDSYIDMTSFAAKLIIEEFSANFDAVAASQFMYKDADKHDSKIYAGPAWDYDLTYGSKNDGLRNPLKEDFVYNKTSQTRHLYRYLQDHADFRAEVRRVFDSDFTRAVEILLGRREGEAGGYVRSIADYTEYMKDSAAMNYSRWPAKAVADLNPDSGLTFDEAIAYLRNWMTKRFDMLDEKWMK